MSEEAIAFRWGEQTSRRANCNELIATACHRARRPRRCGEGRRGRGRGRGRDCSSDISGRSFGPTGCLCRHWKHSGSIDCCGDIRLKLLKSKKKKKKRRKKEEED